MSLPTLTTLLLGLLAGLALGTVHFSTLRFAVRAHLDGQTTFALMLHAARLAVLAAALLLLARWRPPALLAATMGILIARMLIVRRAQHDEKPSIPGREPES